MMRFVLLLMIASCMQSMNIKIVPIWPRKFIARFVISGCAWSSSVQQSFGAVVDTTLKDQLSVLKVLQAENQNANQNQLEDRSGKTIEADDPIIAHGVVSLNPRELTTAKSLDQNFNNEKACLIITASGREGPPLLAHRYIHLDRMEFPFNFDLRSSDLLFPYNEEAFQKSKSSQDSLGIVAILEEDCVLETNSAVNRFGFALSIPKPMSTFRSIDREFAVLDDAPISGTGLGLTPKADGLLRTDALISVSYSSDGKEYSAEEREMMATMDAALARR